jgi:hypothetical protein
MKKHPTQLEVVEESLRLLDKWLAEKDITDSRAKALMRVKAKFDDYHIMLKCKCDVKKYVRYTDEKRK